MTSSCSTRPAASGFTYNDASLSVAEVFHVRAGLVRGLAQGPAPSQAGMSASKAGLGAARADARRFRRPARLARPAPHERRLPVGQTQTPTVPAPPASVPDTVSTLCVAGDLVMHIPIINSRRTDDGYDFTGLFDEARLHYESADYAAACIETTFNGPPPPGFRSSARLTSLQATSERRP
ncbi:MAG: hypothetical protein ACLR4Z_10295 [Butyricicoccaceae bacterium]